VLRSNAPLSALKKDVWLSAAPEDPEFPQLLELEETKLVAVRAILRHFRQRCEFNVISRPAALCPENKIARNLDLRSALETPKVGGL